MHGTRFKWFRSENLLVRNALVILMLVAAVGLLILIAYFYLDDIYLLKARMDLQGVADDISMMELSDKERLETALSDIEAKHNFYIEGQNQATGTEAPDHAHSGTYRPRRRQLF